MLLSNRPSSRRLLGCITLVTFCVVIFQLLGLTKSVTFEAILATIPLPEEKPQASAIPEKIWYKLGPKGLSNESRAMIDTCLQKNPTYQSIFMTDISGDIYVKETVAQTFFQGGHHIARCA